MDNPLHYIQHPQEFPIELNRSCTSGTNKPGSTQLKLVCHSTQAFGSGEQLNIRIPSIQPELAVTGQVDWCADQGNGYELGITFPCDDQLMRIRMLEQLCYIRRYRTHVMQEEGRDLTEQDAALEWISKYAALFPSDSV